MSLICESAERALQLERAGFSCSLDRANSPCCANWSLTSPAGYYVSNNAASNRWSQMWKLKMHLLGVQPLAVLQQPPSEPAAVLLPAAAPPEDHRCRVGSSSCAGRPGRSDVIASRWEEKPVISGGTVTSLAQLLTGIHQGFWFSQKCLTACELEAITAGPSCVQERQLSDSFRLYIEHCLCLMKNMRQVFPCTSAAAITRYELMLR